MTWNGEASTSRRGTSNVNGNAKKGRRREEPEIAGESLADAERVESALGGQFSLAHELAAALMPEPTTSKLLAEEFGLEFEDGGEGEEIDDEEALRTPPGGPTTQDDHSVVIVAEDSTASSADPLTILARNMKTMDSFLVHLRHLDGDYAHNEPPLERAATELIRRLNDSIHDREKQVRQLLELEREFGRIFSEVGGGDVLGSLDALETVEGLLESQTSPIASRSHSRLPSLAEVEEDEWDPSHRLSESQEGLDSPIDSSFHTNLDPSSSTVSSVARLRTDTKSLALTLTALSEQTQVSGAAAAEAGRKIRALKNKIGGWQAEWDSAEKSRARIAEWENPQTAAKRVSGKKLAEEQVSAFRLVLEDAAVRANSILSTS